MSDIHIHPNYDPETLANNIAVVEFNKEGVSEFSTYDYTGPYIYADTALVRRSYAGTGNIMYVPTVRNFSLSNTPCESYSGFLAANDRWLTCNVETTKVIEKPDCVSPFSSIFTRFDVGIAYVAIYSHSVLIGGDFCGNSTKWINYYTYLRTYRQFAYDILQYPIEYINGTEIQSYKGGIASLVPNPALSLDMSGTFTVGGNLFKNNIEYKDNSLKSVPSSSSSITITEMSPTPSGKTIATTETSTSSSATNGNSKNSIQDRAGGFSSSSTDSLGVSSSNDNNNDDDNVSVNDNEQTVSEDGENSNVVQNQKLDDSFLSEDNTDVSEKTKPKKNVPLVAILLPILIVIAIGGFGIYYRLRQQRKMKQQWDSEDARLNALFSSPRKRVRSSNPLAISRHNTMPLRDDAQFVTYVNIKPTNGFVHDLESRFAGLKSKFSFSLPMSIKSDKNRRESR
ncbi:hypothetical protein FB645_003151 [Coemansia sp. IMI 203386]|nr:hypothetical protein FB645_003151 [Coemansia sp. IMI 203386]